MNDAAKNSGPKEDDKGPRYYVIKESFEGAMEHAKECAKMAMVLNEGNLHFSVLGDKPAFAAMFRTIFKGLGFRTKTALINGFMQALQEENRVNKLPSKNGRVIKPRNEIITDMRKNRKGKK